MIERILERTFLLFLSSGFAKTNTDQIAKHIGISKRTLYKYYDTKDKLIDSVFELMRSKVQTKFDKVLQDKEKDPIDRLKEILFFISDMGSKMSKTFAKDIEMVRPDLFVTMREFRKQRILSLSDLLREGQKAGQIRKDVTPELTIDILLAAVDGILNPTYLFQSPYSNTMAFDAIVTIFLEGVQEKHYRVFK
ncbi:TetR/AcrR family transcriptional regulator [Leptospira koniambonensis]|uniref:TetR/AcrR family transcriptional regulator n=2 Tax=Leptospira koniambonensis TaxID=2484950 RepID=A0A4V3JN74_9LEPT|nr:TetR/AcrR family transcriptional regulator [Leptospira koniambonensis]TGL33879.1 TetR/AcrR family transcriptional regulator [Leptospira koniambonensis]